MGKKERKIPVSEFVSDKKLEKIIGIIEKSGGSAEISYDRIENLLEEDFEVKDLGTNRIVLLSKKKKYKDLIFKVACDEHGIEANFREFYNGDLDKRLTFSYSISKQGTFLVQERVKPLKSSDLEDNKGEIREMLKHLGKKILLVDCKVKNFKNFGFRDDGEICLLDHGDTIPLPDYQTTEIVNADEESYVSLKCKGFKDPTSPKIKPCGGRLKYSKNFDYLECEKCGQKISVNDAYKEFYGDLRVTSGKNEGIEVSSEFERWKAGLEEKIRAHCIQSMDAVNNNEEESEGKTEMATEKIINGQVCTQVSGYWIPENLKKGAYAMSFLNLKTGKIKPADFFKTANVDSTEYRVLISDHDHTKKEETLKNKEAQAEREALPKSYVNYDEFADKLITMAIDECNKTGNTNPSIKFEDTGVNISYVIAKETRFRIKADPRVSRAMYDMQGQYFAIDLNIESMSSPSLDEVKNTTPIADESGAKVSNNMEVHTKVSNNKQYLVNGICCMISADYYLPVNLYAPGLDHDETKELLKSERYEPKKFKIASADAVEVNAEEPAEDETPDEELDEKTWISEENDLYDDDDGKRYPEDENDQKSFAETGFGNDEDDDESDEDDADDIDLTDEVDDQHNSLHFVNSYKRFINRAHVIVAAFGENDSDDKFVDDIRAMLVYNDDGIYNMSFTDMSRVINTCAGYNAVQEDMNSEDTTVCQIIINHYFSADEFDMSTSNGTFEFTDTQFAKDCRQYEMLMSLDDSNYFDICSSPLVNFVPKDFNANNTIYAADTYRIAECFEDFLSGITYLANDDTEDPEESFRNKAMYAGVIDKVERISELYNEYIKNVYSYIKDYNLDSYIPIMHQKLRDGKKQYDNQDLLYTIYTFATSIILEMIASELEITRAEVVSIINLSGFEPMNLSDNVSDDGFIDLLCGKYSLVENYENKLLYIVPNQDEVVTEVVKEEICDEAIDDKPSKEDFIAILKQLNDLTETVKLMIEKYNQ